MYSALQTKSKILKGKEKLWTLYLCKYLMKCTHRNKFVKYLNPGVNILSQY